MKRSEAEKLLKELIADYYGVRYLLKDWKRRAEEARSLDIKPHEYPYSEIMVKEYTERLHELKKKIAKLKKMLDKKINP
jgi:hypothetical protein